MRDADRRAIEEAGVPGAALMDTAGTAVADAIRDRYPAATRLTVLCGKGNNGGDGFVAARRLIDRAPEVYLLARCQEVRGDASTHLRLYQEAGGTVCEVPDEAGWQVMREGALDCDVVVDAILGTGLREAPSGLPGRVIADVAQAAAEGVRVVAVDLPSGLSSDTGETPWEHLRAELTVTFAAPKYCHVLPPACDAVGELRIVDIGIPPSLVAGAGLWLLEKADAAAAWPPREPDAHKGRFGHVLVVAGSLGKSGAAVLAGLAALRAGAGLVTVATPAPILPMVAAARAELMTEPLPVAADGGLTPEALEHALLLARDRDAVVVGPGLGQAPGTRAFVQGLVARCPAALVIDADGLNAFGAVDGAPAALDRLRPGRPAVLTPHPGEAAPLLGGSARHVQARRLDAARELAAATGAMVVLKGRRSIVAAPDGLAAVNPTGNPGMATAGTGDVLSGITGALLARGCDAWTAATAATYAHGLAGDRAAERIGQEGMLAGDLLDALAEVLRGLEVGHRR
jgi:NAD(P)H-hydrate epimerase